MKISKKISGKKYYYYDKYDSKQKALKKALELKQWHKSWDRKVRTYIEKIEETQFFLPITMYHLWINGG